MTDDHPESTEAQVQRRRKERLRKAADRLGPLLPSSTSEDTDEGWGEAPTTRDEELRRDVPPHHGG